MTVINTGIITMVSVTCDIAFYNMLNKLTSSHRVKILSHQIEQKVYFQTKFFENLNSFIEFLRILYDNFEA